MDQLIKMVTQQAGITEQQARTAVQVVLGFLKDKLPAPLAGQVENIIKTGAAPDLDDLGKSLGGLFGKKN